MRWITFVALGIVGIAILIYVWNFKSGSISDDTSMWGAFSDYLNAFISLANLAVFVWFSLLVFKYNEDKDIQNESFQRAIERPILVFRSTVTDNDNNEKWAVVNIGNGAALNLRAAESQFRTISWVLPVTKCYSLAKDEKLELDWLKSANVICATYEDIFGNKYVSIGVDDESFVQPLNKGFKEIVIQGNTFKLTDFESFLQLPAQRLRVALNGGSSLVQQTTNCNG
ncbi:MAG TPA: hypothetical protein VMR70_12670 [Flavisolibacter sp.]|nr:hypothetical protein [Flavisolibacter sp.]